MTRVNKSILTEAQLNAIADVLEAHGIDSPYATNYDVTLGVDEKGRKIHPDKIDSVDLSGLDLADMWKTDVHAILGERRHAKWKAGIREKYAAVQNEHIRAYLLKAFDDNEYRGWREPEVTSLTGLRGRDTAPKYKPVGDCGAKLKLSEAVAFAYEQQSYADHSFFVVPFDGEVKDREVALKNLRLLAASWRTHTGWAGSGSDWSVSLVDNVVILECRSSISD